MANGLLTGIDQAFPEEDTTIRKAEIPTGLFDLATTVDDPARNAMIQQLMDLRIAQLSPQQQGAFLARQFGGQVGRGLGGVLSALSPQGATNPEADPQRRMQEAIAEVDQFMTNVRIDDDDPMSVHKGAIAFHKKASEALWKRGFRRQALEAMNRALDIKKQGADVTYKDILGQEALTRKAEALYKLGLDIQTKPLELEKRELEVLGKQQEALKTQQEVRKLATENKFLAQKIAAEIASAKATAAKSGAELKGKKVEDMLTELLTKKIEKAKVGEKLHPAEEDALNRLINIKDSLNAIETIMKLNEQLKKGEQLPSGNRDNRIPQTPSTGRPPIKFKRIE